MRMVDAGDDMVVVSCVGPGQGSFAFDSPNLAPLVQLLRLEWPEVAAKDPLITEGTFVAVRAQPLSSSSADTGPVPTLEKSTSPARVSSVRASTVGKENCVLPHQCIPLSHKSSSSSFGARLSRPSASRFLNGVRKLVAPPSGIPLTLLNGSVRRLRSLELTSRPMKHHLYPVIEEARTTLDNEDEYEVVHRPAKKQVKVSCLYLASLAHISHPARHRLIVFTTTLA